MFGIKFDFYNNPFISQVGSEGGGELLVPWPEAMVLIVLLPGGGKHEGGTSWPAGRILMRPPSISLVCGSGIFLLLLSYLKSPLNFYRTISPQSGPVKLHMSHPSYLNEA